ncbi:hypothetical protein HK096_006847 [Nowakowskiella sp. JEL0078]|nr:hypothetical protein HK096_006847 [Nowakowskiella sp. JEL0078]
MTSSAFIESVDAVKLESGTRKVTFVTLKNDNVIAKFTSYGAALTHFIIPTSSGPKDIVLGYDTQKEYVEYSVSNINPCFGSIVGRVANRTKNGKFELNGQLYQLEKNLGDHNLHSRPFGLDSASFVTKITSNSVSSVAFSYLSPDGESGYPGAVQINVTYTLLTNPISLKMAYEAHIVTSATPTIKTPINLTNHTYFNLTGFSSPTINTHKLKFPVGTVTGILEYEEGNIPTGKVIPLESKPLYNFTEEKTVGHDFELGGVKESRGYDHFYTINPTVISAAVAAITSNKYLNIPPVAVLTSPDNTLSLELRTTTPGFQLYTGQWISEKVKAKSEHALSGKVEHYGAHSGIALETSFPVDAVNKESVGWHHGVVIGKDEIWKHETIYTVRLNEVA